MAKFSSQRTDCKFLMGITAEDQMMSWLELNPGIIGIAMLGRSNVGKSTLINSFFGSKTAKTSKTPGRTRQINVFEINLEQMPDEVPNTFYLFDLPGYGHAAVSKDMSSNWEKLMSAFFSYTSGGVIILNIQDARHPDQKADKDFHQFLKPLDLPTFLAFNKSDKLKTQKERSQLGNLKPKLFNTYKWVKGIFFISAEKRSGLDELEDALISFMLKKQQENSRTSPPSL